MYVNESTMYVIGFGTAEITLDETEARDLLHALGAMLKIRTGTPETVIAPVPTAQEISAARSGQKILAIRDYRTRTGMGLKEAKDVISAHMAANVPDTRYQIVYDDGTRSPWFAASGKVRFPADTNVEFRLRDLTGNPGTG